MFLTPGVDEAGNDCDKPEQFPLNEQTETSSGIFLRLFKPR